MLFTMKYIFLKKNKDKNSNVLSVLQISSLFEKIFNNVTENNFIVDVGKNDYIVEYKIAFNAAQEMSYVNISADYTESKAINILDTMHNKLIKGQHRKEYHIVLTFDVVSAYYCNKIYPLFNKFERLIRELIFDILLKALGIEGYQKSFSKELKDYLKSKNIKNDSKLIEDALYELDIYQLEEYLFTPISEIDFTELLNNDLNEITLNQLKKEDIIYLINKCRSRSLWDRFFKNSNVSIPNIDVDKLNGIRIDRNKIAHNKFFYKSNYNQCKASLTELNKGLEAAINELMVINFNENNAEDAVISIDKTFVKNSNFDYKPYITSFTMSILGILVPFLDKISNKTKISKNVDISTNRMSEDNESLKIYNTANKVTTDYKIFYEQAKKLSKFSDTTNQIKRIKEEAISLSLDTNLKTQLERRREEKFKLSIELKSKDVNNLENS